MMLYTFSDGERTVEKEFTTFSEVLNEFTKTFENLFRFFTPVYNDFSYLRDEFVSNEELKIGPYIWHYLDTNDFMDSIDTNDYEDNGETWVEEVERMLAD